MKDVSLSMVLAILQDMFGILLWIGVASAIVVTLFFVVALLRQRGFRGPAARIGLAAGAIAAAAAILVAPFVTQASFANVLGVIDWMALALLGLSVFAAVAITLFTIAGMMRGPAAAS